MTKNTVAAHRMTHRVVPRDRAEQQALLSKVTGQQANLAKRIALDVTSGDEFTFKTITPSQAARPVRSLLRQALREAKDNVRRGFDRETLYEVRSKAGELIGYEISANATDSHRLNTSEWVVFTAKGKPIGFDVVAEF